MLQLKKTVFQARSFDLSHPEYYFSREGSWLEFNRRVLQEAMNPENALLERVKFTAICSRNLDEYFMVRVALLKSRAAAGVRSLSADGRTPEEQLELIHQRLTPVFSWQHRYFEQTLRPELAAQGVLLLNYSQLTPAQQAYLEAEFAQKIFPLLTPLAIDARHPSVQMTNLSLNLAVSLRDRETGAERLAQVKIPEGLSRWLPLPQALLIAQPQKAHWVAVPLEQVIAAQITSLFPGLEVLSVHPFRVTCDADLELQEEAADDLLLAIEQELQKRRLGGAVVRLEVAETMPVAVQLMLMEDLGLQIGDVYRVEGMLGLQDLIPLTELPLPELQEPVWQPVVHPRLRSPKSPGSRRSQNRRDTATDMFAEIRKQDLLVHHPYHSFSRSVERFVAEAAHDPDVLSIKMTLYRTSGDSPIVRSLIEAAQNGKQVAVIVELKARFDEENNINWARCLERAGVNVVYGMVGLKTHTKTILVIRQEASENSVEESCIRRYVHIGTGNYNSKTARFYTDLGLFSCRDDLGADLTDLFNYLTGYSRQRGYRKLLVAPANLRRKLLELIHREAEHSRRGRPGRIVAQMNGLIDPQIIGALYAASQAGVEIDLIVRGICCLRPGLPGVSDRIRVVSVIGKFLEHTRIIYCYNNGQEQVFLGSADWMPRNLDRRVEAMVPIEDPEIAQDVQAMLGMMLADNCQSWDLQANGTYLQRRPLPGCQALKAQTLLMEMAVQSESSGT